MNPLARAVRADVLRASEASGHGHVPTCFSVVEALLAIYGVMRHDPARPDDPERDLFVLSKGHAALGHYAVLAHLGYLPADELSTFGGDGSRLGCHADRHKVPGVEVSTGSLGHGIGVAVGMAMGLAIRGSGRRVFTLVGDGEANEGSVWEALMVAADQRLTNLTVVLDWNRSQGRALQLSDPAAMLRGFGCAVTEVDGHDEAALRDALNSPSDTVRAVVARTVKGYGCATLQENMYEWHRKSPDADTLARLLGELDAQAV